MCLVGLDTASSALCPRRVLSCKIGEINMNHPWTPVSVPALPKLFQINLIDALSITLSPALFKDVIRSVLAPKSDPCL